MIELMIDGVGSCCRAAESGLGLGKTDSVRLSSDGVLRRSVLLSKQICGMEISTWWWWRFESCEVEGVVVIVVVVGLDGVSAKWRGDEKSPSSSSSRRMSFSSLVHCGGRRCCCCCCCCSVSTYPFEKNMTREAMSSTERAEAPPDNKCLLFAWDAVLCDGGESRIESERKLSHAAVVAVVVARAAEVGE